MKVTYWVASSIDGYIARDDGDVSWLEELDVPLEETGYEEFCSTVDGLVMGLRLQRWRSRFEGARTG